MYTAEFYECDSVEKRHYLSIVIDILMVEGKVKSPVGIGKPPMLTVSTLSTAYDHQIFSVTNPLSPKTNQIVHP